MSRIYSLINILINQNVDRLLKEGIYNLWIEPNNINYNELLIPNDRKNFVPDSLVVVPTIKSIVYDNDKTRVFTLRSIFVRIIQNVRFLVPPETCFAVKRSYASRWLPHSRSRRLLMINGIVAGSGWDLYQRLLTQRYESGQPRSWVARDEDGNITTCLQVVGHEKSGGTCGFGRRNEHHGHDRDHYKSVHDFDFCLMYIVERKCIFDFFN